MYKVMFPDDIEVIDAKSEEEAIQKYLVRLKELLESCTQEEIVNKLGIIVWEL